MSTEQRPTCGQCRFFEQKPYNERGDCFGNPPVLVQRPTRDKHAIWSMRPQVNDTDIGCRLWESSAAQSPEQPEADIISGPD